MIFFFRVLLVKIKLLHSSVRQENVTLTNRMLILSKTKIIVHNGYINKRYIYFFFFQIFFLLWFFCLHNCFIMGNSLPQNRSKNGSQYLTLTKSRSLREYTRSTSLLTSCLNSNNNRRNISFSRPHSIAPTDAEIIDIHALRCQISTSDINQNEKELLKQLDYIHSCVRKDKGLFGKLIEFK